jgi:hypothetical protein
VAHSDGSTDCAQQRLLVEGLSQVAGRPGLLDALEGRSIVMGRDEDDPGGELSRVVRRRAAL